MGMGIDYKIGNGNGKEWECKKPFPVISTVMYYCLPIGQFVKK